MNLGPIQKLSYSQNCLIAQSDYILDFFFQQNPGKGTCDGVYRKQRYFKCPPESGVFVAIHRIHKSKKSSKELASVHQDGAAAHLAVDTGLPIGSKVVWLSDTGPEVGVVKWVGVLPDARRQDDITVGVEFVSFIFFFVFVFCPKV